MAARITLQTASASTEHSRPRASVVVTRPVASAEHTAPKAALTASLVNASAAILVPAAAVSYVEITVGAVLDDTGRYAFVAETCAIVDTLGLNLDKTLDDSFLTGSTLRLDFAKVLTHEAVTTDALAYEFAKQLAHTYATDDKLAYDLVKRAFDAVGLSDAASKALSKLIADGVGMNDSFDTTDGSLYSFVKSVTNFAFTSDDLRREVTKKLTDSAVAHSLTALHVTKAPFNSETALGDALATHPSLVKTDTAQTSDRISADITNLLVDSLAVAEFVSLLVSKPLAEELTAQEAFAIDFDAPKAESVLLSDPASYSMGKLLDESVGLSDTVITVLIFLRNFADMAPVYDIKVLSVDKALPEAVVAADILVHDYERRILDGVGMSDFTGVGDGLAFVLTSTLANAAFTADSLRRDTQARRTSTATTTDGGTIIQQDYCDLTYFAGDYIGTARFF